jgi:predicted phage terminase large subunit-like protein
MSNTQDEYEGVSGELDYCRSSFLSYCIAQYSDFVAPRHIIHIAKKLEAVERGEIKRLMIFAPPRHGKSETTTKLFPAWFIGRNPKKFVAIASYGQDLSDQIGNALNQRLNSDVFKEVFPNCKMSPSSNGIRQTMTTQGGGFFVVGVGGALTGRGANLRIIDDPNKGWEDANSDDAQKKQWDWWTSVFYTRGNQQISEEGISTEEDDSPIIIILTRWSDKDLASKLIKKMNDEKNVPNSDKWEIVDLPAISISDNDCLGRPPAKNPEDPTTWIDANALWPGMMGAKKLGLIKSGVGPQVWNSLYQQRPSSSDGNLFLRTKWQWYQELPDDCNRPVQAWDCNYHKTTDSDFAVGITAAKRNTNSIYLINRRKGRWTFPELCAQVIEEKRAYPETTAIYIERKAAGQPVIDTVSLTIPGIIAVDPETLGSKDSRWQSAAHYQQAGNFYLPLGVLWTDEFVEVMSSIPNGEYDDDADAFAMLVLKELGAFQVDALLRVLEQQLREMGIDVKALNSEASVDNPYAVYEIAKKSKTVLDKHSELRINTQLNGFNNTDDFFFQNSLEDKSLDDYSWDFSKLM